MGAVEVVDRGSQEIVVFLRGDLGDVTHEALNDASAEVVRHEPPRVVVDTHECTHIGTDGLLFLEALRSRGRMDGYKVDLAAIGPAVHDELEDAGWIFPILTPHHHSR